MSEDIDFSKLDEYLTALNGLRDFLIKAENHIAFYNQKVKKDLLSDEWPVAVDPELICDETSEADKMERAENILDSMMPGKLNGKFLDFGCGEGYVPRFLHDKNQEAIGFDIKKQWDDKYNFLTDNWDYVVQNGPYENILVYDVLDHSMEEEPSEALRKIKTVLAPNGEIQIRFHPWCSRHGTHLYNVLNKAYAHVIFSEEELESWGYKGIPTRQVKFPVATYKKWIEDAGLKWIDPVISSQEPENYFKSRKLGYYFQDAIGTKEFPQVQIRQQFCDFIVKN